MPWDEPGEYPCSNCHWYQSPISQVQCATCGKSGAPARFLARNGTCDACHCGVSRSYHEWECISGGDAVLCCSCAERLLNNVDQLRKDAGIDAAEFYPSACETNKKRSVLRKFRRKS